jgi:hypothetical protein
MIRWPEPHKVSPAARKYLPRFRETAAGQELAEDPHTWVLEATSWSDEFPVRLIWRNEDRREVCFILEEDGMWRLVPYETMPVVPNPYDLLSPRFIS